MDESSDIDLLNLAHTTTWRSLEQILKEGRISARSPFPPKDANPSSIIYLFYGMPFYVVAINETDVSTTSIADRPIGLLLKTDILVDVKRCYPFDTGAYFDGLFERLFNLKGINIADFEVTLGGNFELQKLIKRYFQSNENYCRSVSSFKGEKKSSIEDLLIRLHRIETNDLVDNRVAAIEVHYPNDLLINGKVEAILLPDRTYKENKTMLSGVEKLCEIRTYLDNNRFGARGMCQLIMDAAHRYYVEKKMINAN
jgi:hypothetical protein